MPTTDTPNSNLKDALVALAFILMMILPALAWLWIQQESKCIPPECISGVSPGVATKYSDAAKTKQKKARERAEATALARTVAQRPKIFLHAARPGFTTANGIIKGCFTLSDFKLPSKNTNGKQQLKHVLNAPCLYNRYPTLGDAIVQFRKKCVVTAKLAGRRVRNEAGGIAGYQSICISSKYASKVIASIILHEVQHLIQRLEGRHRGKHDCYQRELEAEFAQAIIVGLSKFDPTAYPSRLKAADCNYSKMRYIKYRSWE